MFKNPLKYQQGGQTVTTQQQEQLVQLFQIAAQNAQVDPQALVQKAQELGQDKQAAAQFMEGLQRCAQGDPAGIKFIQDLFKQPAYKQGGKIHDFICKHANGGKAGCGCGGSVKKAQGGETMPYTRGSYQPSDYFNNTGTWIETPNGVAQNYRPYFIGGRDWGFGGNDLEQILVVPGVTGIPRRAVRRISNWFNPDVPTEKLDTTYQDANGNSKNSAEFEARVNRELEGISGQRPVIKDQEPAGPMPKTKEVRSNALGKITLYTEPSKGTTALRDSVFYYVPPKNPLMKLPESISRVYLEIPNGRGYESLTNILSGKGSKFGAESDFNMLRNMWNTMKK